MGGSLSSAVSQAWAVVPALPLRGCPLKGASALPFCIQGGQWLPSPGGGTPWPMPGTAGSPAPLALAPWRGLRDVSHPAGRGWPPSCSSSCALHKTTVRACQLPPWCNPLDS